MAEIINATLSFHQDTEHNEKHDKREIRVPNADPAYEHTNIYYENNMTIGEAFQYLFEKPIEEYNEKQYRNDRKLEGGALGYLDRLLDKKQQEDQKIKEMRRNGETKSKINRSKVAIKPSYQFIVTVGNLQDTPEFKAIGGEKRDVAISILKEYMDTFQERNPNIFMYTGAIHCDEGGMPHLHGSVCFVARDLQKGVSVQISQKKALEQMGFVDDERGKGKKKGEYQLAITKWQNREREYLKELMLARGVNFILGRGNEPHMTTKQWQAQQDIKKAENMLNIAYAEQALLEEEKVAMREHFETEREKLEIDKKEAAQRIKEKEQESIRIINTLSIQKGFPADVATIYKEHGEMKKKLSKKQKEEQEEKEMLAELWDDFKKANSSHWEDYRDKKAQLRALINESKKEQKDNSKEIRELMNYIYSRNGFILFKLAALIIALCLKIRDNYLKKQLNALYERNEILKATSKTILSDSKNLSIALKNKDFDMIENAINQWNNNFINVISETQYTIENVYGRKERHIEEIKEKEEQDRQHHILDDER